MERAWRTHQQSREDDGLPAIGGIPLLLEVDPTMDIEALRSMFDFEIISEEEDGYVIVASDDISLSTFQRALRGFAGAIHGSGNVAKVLSLVEDQDARLRLVLSETMYDDWSNISERTTYICDIGLACVGTVDIPRRPKRNPRWSEHTWARRENEWTNKRVEAYDLWDELKKDRFRQIHGIVQFYNGEILQDTYYDGDTLPDSFTLRIKITGNGLKDIVFNIPHIFEVVEPDDIELPQRTAHEDRAFRAAVNVEAPGDDDPAVCVIDSGIQEEHFLLAPAIDRPASHCFLPGTPQTDIADYVRPGGHGTRVAGAVLYGNSIVKTGTFRAHTWIQNARVLDDNCNLPDSLLPPVLLRTVIEQYRNGPRHTRIYNHSINARWPCRTVHMAAWAAEIDRICHDFDILIIQSAGNLSTTGTPTNPGVQDWLENGPAYPHYLQRRSCRVANPAQSLQALTVGSVACDSFNADGWRSLAQRSDAPSGFSRSGPGIWGCTKPEVVEYGGDDLYTGARPPTVGTPPIARQCYPELVRSTMYDVGPAFDRDETGTSFSAPKVAHIAAHLQSTLPDASCLLYRALLVQSARWPAWSDTLQDDERAALFRSIGFGLPDLGRATTNTDERVTYVSATDMGISAGECHIYQVRIPEVMRRPGDDFLVRIEVTLSYVASPRRTRRHLRGYLAVWADWVSNRRGETVEAFRSRILKESEDVVQQGSSFGWKLGTLPHHGEIPEARRGAGTVQKDWTELQSNQLPQDICIAVRGHKGWSKDPDATARYAVALSLEAIDAEVPIYAPLEAAVAELRSELEVPELEFDELDLEFDELEVELDELEFGAEAQP